MHLGEFRDGMVRVSFEKRRNRLERIGAQGGGSSCKKLLQVFSLLALLPWVCFEFHGRLRKNESMRNNQPRPEVQRQESGIGPGVL
jgi:hypothetical protein